MAVFDGAVKIGRAVADPGTDQTLPPSGALSFGAIKSNTALASTTGIDAKLVHGDRWQEIAGSLNENIHQNQKTTVDQNHNRTVTGNQVVRVVGTTTDTRVDSQLKTFYNSSTFIYNQPRVEQHSATEQKHNPTTESELKNEHLEHTSWKVAGTGLHMEGKGMAVEGKAVSLDGVGAGAGLYGITADVGGIGVEGVLWKEKAEALSGRLQGFCNRLVGAEVKAGGPETKILPVIIGICVAVHLDSPFG